MNGATQYRYEFISGEEFRSVHNDHYHAQFAHMAYVRPKTLYTEAEAEKLKELDIALSQAVNLFLVAFDGDTVIGWCWGLQDKTDTFYMKNSAVLPEFRRKGVYSEIMKRVVAKAADMGFQHIYSKHNASNNAVIIAKLKAGFMISGMEVSDQFGTLVQLSYFPNRIREDLFCFRAGEKKLDAAFASQLVQKTD